MGTAASRVAQAKTRFIRPEPPSLVDLAFGERSSREVHRVTPCVTSRKLQPQRIAFSRAAQPCELPALGGSDRTAGATPLRGATGTAGLAERQEPGGIAGIEDLNGRE